jgi:ABC-type transport system involved in cytochrome c biogenesis permease subunit
MMDSPETTLSSMAWNLLRAAGSLKITVVMFMAAIFLVFVGTLAQDEMNMPDVKATFFNCWIAWVKFADFFPVTVFGESTLTGGFPFLGGATIGLVMLVNLIAAKVTRFHVAAHGQRLVWGSVLTLIGGLITLGVILTGHRSDGLQGRPPFDYDVVWQIVQAGGVLLAAALVAAAYAAPTKLPRRVAATAAVIVAVVAWLTIFGGDNWRLNEPALRIMWQLIQSSVASLVLLAGLVMVFGSRGGNVLIHLAVGLLMVGQFAFGDRQIEERMLIVEGEATTMAARSDEVELAVIEPGDTEDRVTVISDRLLQARADGDAIDVDGLPFAIRVVSYFRNSSVQPAGQGGPTKATAGLGRKWAAVGQETVGGASSQTNIASAYVQLIERETGRDLGTFLVTQFLNDAAEIFVGAMADECDTVTADGRDWRLCLRFRREYKPYSVTLDDVRRINYSASSTPRDYSSYVTFTDLATGDKLPGQRIWMNNPVRYRGETFFQSTYTPVDLGNGETTEMTGLLVVENAGWLVPYVACVLAFWGMLVHFGGTFLRFADRHERTERLSKHGTSSHQSGGLFIPAHALIGVTLIALLAAVPRSPGFGKADFSAAGRLPVMHEGRIKPLDTVARNTLQLLSNRTSVTMPSGEGATAGDPQGSLSASRWLLAVMSGSKWADRAPVFRIDAKEVVDLFDLTRRPGHRYSYAEIEPKRPELRRLTEPVRKLPREELSFVQRKFIELEQKLMAYDVIRVAYEAPQMPALPGDDATAREAFLADVMRLMQGARLLEDNHPPAALPPVGRAAIDPAKADATNRWQALHPALVKALVAKLIASRPGQPAYEPSPALVPFVAMLEAVDQGGPEFNAALAAYRTAASSLPQFQASVSKAAAEAWFNAFNPIDLAKWLYVALTATCFAVFLVGGGPFRRSVWWWLLGTFVLHSFALGMRIWLSGRPPVVNLYSSAVFIGWGCVLAGLLLEQLHRMGIGNLLAAVAGGLTLMVAYGLDSGDTMHVLQAVLDTQFWLSTHVITVTLGYGATFLAGLLGTCSIIHRFWTLAHDTEATQESREIQDRLYRMNYGVVCFALFLSFIGTVLGGLWADDSWGRFWGWDPKENGALMIVLWNAAVLHARWDRWIGPRGFAMFTIGGNIVTAWSWFGTNQLGIGLHSYGFTSGVLMLLGAYVASQLVLLALVGLLALIAMVTTSSSSSTT